MVDINLKKRNQALLIVLGGLALLFYAVSFVRIPGF